MNIEISKLDSDRFGIKIARTVHITSDTLEEVINYCELNNVKMLIARCDVTEIKTVQEMEKLGFILCDTQVYFKHSLENIPKKKISEIFVRPSKIEDAEQIRKITINAFKNYYGHYHQDKRLNPELIEEGYGEWAYNVSLLPKGRNETLVAIDNEKVVGAISFRLNTDIEGEVVVGSIAPEYQQRGIYTNIFIRGLEWHKEMGCKYQLTSTQNLNIAVQRVWCRLGYEPYLEKAYYTMHKYFYNIDINKLHKHL